MNFAKVYETVEEAIRTEYGVEPLYDERLDRYFWLWDDQFSLDDDNRPRPNFSVQEAAQAFFGKTSWWLRWCYRAAPGKPNGSFVLNGVLIVPKRTAKGSRYYTLADIERMAHALAEGRSISGEKVAQIMSIVLILAAQHGVFEPRRTR